MTIIQHIAKALSAIEVAVWYWVVQDVENLFKSFDSVSKPARWLFALLIAPLLVVWALVVCPIYAMSRRQYQRQQRP